MRPAGASAEFVREGALSVPTVLLRLSEMRADILPGLPAAMQVSDDITHQVTGLSDWQQLREIVGLPVTRTASGQELCSYSFDLA